MTERILDLSIGGMTCASCAARVEKKLNRMDGVTAAVNFATERARVTVPDSVHPDSVVAAIEAAGYRVRLPATPALAHAGHTERAVPSIAQPPTSAAQPATSTAQPATSAAQPATSTAAPADPELAGLRQRLVGSLVLAIPVVLLAMVPVLQFRFWQWAALTLASPVVAWGAWPFHRAAWRGLRHRTATMDTLISMGVVAAYGWSLYALFLGDAGMAGVRMPFDLFPARGQGSEQIYLEVASALTVFLLAGRYFE
ncbi:MAG TPA: cation transporter, partial [Actinopolymorphaceae bacterium]|nr:cation transporter [Actinopolymorphaceae bacterium]